VGRERDRVADPEGRAIIGRMIDAFAVALRLLPQDVKRELEDVERELMAQGRTVEGELQILNVKPAAVMLWCVRELVRLRDQLLG
jgi:hypothetical protein